MPEELERLLRRYRPVGPPPELRAMVVGHRSTSGDWAWLAAAAALAVVTVLLRTSSGNALAASLQPTEAPHAASVRALAASLESEEYSYVLAETIVLQEHVRADHAATPGTSNPGTSNPGTWNPGTWNQ